MLRSHLIQFLRKIKSMNRAPGLKLVPSSIMSGPLGPLILMGFVQAQPHWATG